MEKSPLKAIKKKCLDCSCGSTKEVKLCPITTCELYPFRLGKNPFLKRKLTENQRAAALERLAKSKEERGDVEDAECC